MHNTDELDELIDIRLALEQLTAKQRQAMLLILEGYTHIAAANKLGISRTSVSRRIQRARKVLKAEN